MYNFTFTIESKLFTAKMQPNVEKSLVDVV